MNYTTLGYGNVIMTPAWRALGPLEAANGMLLFGVSTALIFAVIQRIIQTRLGIVAHEETMASAAGGYFSPRQRK